jgi:8-amino-7-oxononanoate synthase
MKRVDIGMRPKRFNVLPTSSVQLIVETMTGAKLTAKVTDASLKGLAAVFTKSDVEQHLTDFIEVGEILPESKLFWDDRECPLGRLSLIRRSELPDGSVKVAMSCVDTRIPLTGHLARHFAEIDRGAANPLDFELNAPRFSVADFAEAEFQHPDLFERCRQYKILLTESRKNPLFQYYAVKESDDGARARYRLPVTKKRIDAVSFSSYDYLGLSKEPAVIDGAIRAMKTFGLSPNGSMILSGKTELHEKLEYEVSRWLRKDDALIFSSGFAANIGALTGLLRPNDLVVADIYAHASIMDGISASKATARFFKHNDLSNLESTLKKLRNDYNGAMIVTEGVFSMEGSTPDLSNFVRIAKENNCRTFVDECHSTGICGSNGLGVAERDNVLADIDVYMSTFNKALGVGGIGFVAGDKEVIEWLRYFGRAGMFSAAVSAGQVGAALEALKIVSADTSHRYRLLQNIQRLRDGLKSIGLKTESDPQSPIVPVVIADEARLGRLNQSLLDMGIFVNCVMYPAVPLGQARFRFSMTAKHSSSDIDLAINALKIALEREKNLFGSDDLEKHSKIRAVS